MTPRVERFVYDSAMGLSLVLEKPKSVYVVPPLVKAIDDDYNPLAEYTKTAHVALGRSLGIKAGEFIAEKHQAGKHDQETHGNWAGDRFSPDSVKSARDGAKEYAFKNGIKQDDTIEYDEVVANRARASKIADAYDGLPKFDEDAVDEYEALATEVEQQYDYMTKTLGIKVEFISEDPYKTSKEMFAEVSTGKLRVLRTASTGAHPLFSNQQNDKFRAVHDYFGHAATGRGFGQDGEEAAWVHHSQMFTKKARGALTTETRGQNSWYNTRKNGFADQKVALLPEQYWEVPAVFAKHYAGQHDQSTHGSWAHGTGGDTFSEDPRYQEALKEYAKLSESDKFNFTQTNEDDFNKSPIGKLIIEYADKKFPNNKAISSAKNNDKPVKKNLEVREGLKTRFIDEGLAQQDYEESGIYQMYFENIYPDIMNVVTSGKLAIAMDGVSFNNMINSGKSEFKNQFQTKSSNGLLDPSMRKKGELANQYIPVEVKPSDRPIYGYVSPDDSLDNVTSLGTFQYGEIKFVLKDSVRDRATMTIGDSLGTRAFPMKINKQPSVKDVMNATNRAMRVNYGRGNKDWEGQDSFAETEYFEAQIFGGVSAKDIEMIYVPNGWVAPPNFASVFPNIEVVGYDS
jgi:hypothetical protein